MARSALLIDSKDDLAVALRDLSLEKVDVNGDDIAIIESVDAKHQFAMRDLAAGEKVRMYGVVVGEMKQPVPRGGRITRDRMVHASDDYTFKESSFQWTAPDVSRWANRTFDGYGRSDGKVGTGNYWIVVPMVFCENRNLDVIEKAMMGALGYSTTGPYEGLVQGLVQGYQSGQTAEQLMQVPLPEENSHQQQLFPNVDGVKFLKHYLGCGGMRSDAKNLCHLLAGYINHPNVAGATIMSLGCQNAEVSVLLDELKRRNPKFDKPLHVLEQHGYPSERALLDDAIKKTFLGLIEANHCERTPFPISKLTIGVECGASDGFSGLSANPVIGQVSDFLVGLGGASILSEFPELCGVEQELVDRCASKEVAAQLVKVMRNYEAQAKAVGGSFDMNPSPGNIRDGLITDAIKSAGAARKGGSSPVVDALDYPEEVTRAGLSLLCTPGGDVESTTAMVGAGANMVLFSTGMGTPTGNPIAPVLKISSNTQVAERQPDIIDFDAGPIIRGETDLPSLGGDLLELVIETASGKYKPHAVRLGQDDFIPWKRGVSL